MRAVLDSTQNSKGSQAVREMSRATSCSRGGFSVFFRPPPEGPFLCSEAARDGSRPKGFLAVPFQETARVPGRFLLLPCQDHGMRPGTIPVSGKIFSEKIRRKKN